MINTNVTACLNEIAQNTIGRNISIARVIASATSQCTMQLNLMALSMACGGFVDRSCAVVVLATDLNALTILHSPRSTVMVVEC
jgi:hypothetical protein